MPSVCLLKSVQEKQMLRTCSTHTSEFDYIIFRDTYQCIPSCQASVLLLLVIHPVKAACQRPNASQSSAFQNKILNRRVKNNNVKQPPTYQVFTVAEHKPRLNLKWG